MMAAHPSHDWSDVSGHCTACSCYVLSLDARMPCKPSTDDARPCDTEPPAEPDYAAITRGLAG